MCSLRVASEFIGRFASHTSPLTVAEKQALLECKSIVERGELLSNLLEMAS